jgi:6-phosphofructokinase 2
VENQLRFYIGGPGEMIKDLLSEEGIALLINQYQSGQREFVAVDDNTNSQYRFGFPGSIISSVETGDSF